MKVLFLVGIMVFGISVFAETQLICWSVYAKKDSRATMTATIGKGSELSHIQFNFADKAFAGYARFQSNQTVAKGHFTSVITLSALENPSETVSPQMITTSGSPYQGNDEYNFLIGHYSVTSPSFNTTVYYGARLILPHDLSNEGLKNYRLRVSNEWSNAVIIYSPAYDSDSRADNNLRLYCVAK